MLCFYPTLERRSTVLLLLLLCMYVCHAQGTPRTLKRGGLESSGQIVISSKGKTNIITFVVFSFLDFCILFKDTKTTTQSYQDNYWTKKWPKMGQNIIISSFLPEGQKNLGWRLKPSAGARSRPAKWAVHCSSLECYILIELYMAVGVDMIPLI